MRDNEGGQCVDLRFDIPAGAALARLHDKVSRVIVVGAGVAGLTITNALKAADVEVVLLEARTRLGGRIHTVRLQDGKVDAGASWIHQPDDNPLSVFADAVGIPRKAFALTTIFSKMRLVDREGNALNDAERDRVLAIAGDAADEVVENASSADGAASIKALVDDAIARSNDLSDPTWAEFIVRTWFETDLAAPLIDIAPINLDSDEPGEDDGDDVLEGGYAALLAPLSADLPIRAASLVTNIASDGNGVVVRCADGHIECGSHAVMTVPLGVLKAEVISFEPGLDAEKSSAIERLGFGRFEKLILQFESRFWASSEDVSGFLIKGEPMFAYWIDLTAINGKPTLVAHMTGPAAERLVSMGGAAALSEACDVLRRVTNMEIPTPVAMHLTNWSADAYTRGSYMHYAPLSSPADVLALAAPHDKRVLFAGEATVQDRYGYVDGAFSSGLREAGRLLDCRSIKLSLRPHLPLQPSS